MREHGWSELSSPGVIGRLWAWMYSEEGVVTVEWVALAAGLAVGAIVISYIIMHGLVAPANHVVSQLSP